MKGQVGRSGNRLVHKYGPETLVVEAWGRDGLRVRATVRAHIDDRAWALTEDTAAAAVQIEIGDEAGTITNGRISARVTDNTSDPQGPGILQAGYVQFFKDDALVLLGVRVLAMQTALQLPRGIARSGQGTHAARFAFVRPRYRFPTLEEDWRLEAGS